MFQSKLLNLNENIGISEIRRYENIKVNASIIQKLFAKASFPVSIPIQIPIQNKALAGVGNPINEEVCLSSILNFASLNAENTAIMKARSEERRVGKEC